MRSVEPPGGFMRALLLFVCAVVLSPAQDKVGTGVKDASVDYWDSVSDYYRNSRRAVMALRDKGVPDEEIPAVLHIARNSTASPNQVLEARKSGKAWTDIAREHNVKFSGSDLVAEANVQFLSTYHGRTPEEVRAMKAKGASWIDINQELRRTGTAVKARTPGK
jgi:hypothetical protein